MPSMVCTYDVISTPLAEESHAYHHEGPVTAGTGVEELSKVPPRVLIPVHVHLFHDLIELQLDEWGSSIAVRMVFRKEMFCLLPAIFCHKPSRRFREEEHSNHNDRRHKALNHGWSSPGPAVVDVLIAAICDPTR